ncbi:MAG: hypothetical protein LBT59_02895 [Clostridiales bacterium]|nr:hypothetical protein [Clostridiales bacterium]
MDIPAIINSMTLEEKAGLCSGMDNWCTKPVERLRIPSIRMSDGPHGLRKEDEANKKPGNIFAKSMPAVCYPAACATAASFDPELCVKRAKH